MVNTGKPSNGCVQCRARRVKCDGSRPRCERCRKYGIVCPGYPENGFVFRDLTVAVRERASKKYEKNRRVQPISRSPAMRVKKSVDPETKRSSTHQRDPSAAREKIPDICALTPAVLPDRAAFIDAAVAAFLSQWANSNVDVWWGILDVTTIQSSSSIPKGSLGIALQAASLMALALRPEFQHRDLKRSAAMMYGTALRTINKSLHDPKESLENNTFIAVMLIALFEHMDEMMDDDPAAAHVRGMISLINARGPDQFRSRAGRKIFLYTYFTWVRIAFNPSGNVSPRLLSNSLSSPKTATVMPDIAVMPHMAPTSIPLLDAGLIDILLQHHDFGIQEPAFRLLPLIHRSVILRATSMSSLQQLTDPSDFDSITSIICDIDTLDQELLAWNSSLPHGVWGEQDHLYQMLTTSWFRTHRIFLADLSIRCYQRLAKLDGRTYDAQIFPHTDEAQNAIDQICVRIPYSFAPDNPRKRKPTISPRVVPHAKITYLYHASFEYPLLISSMVWTLPPFRQEGIETARKQCAKACGLAKPPRKHPKVLIYLTPEERARYIRFRNERAQRWLLQGQTDEGTRFPFQDPVSGKVDAFP